MPNFKFNIIYENLVYFTIFSENLKISISLYSVIKLFKIEEKNKFR